jgi:hypothetical protein
MENTKPESDDFAMIVTMDVDIIIMDIGIHRQVGDLTFIQDTHHGDGV